MRAVSLFAIALLILGAILWLWNPDNREMLRPSTGPTATSSQGVLRPFEQAPPTSETHETVEEAAPAPEPGDPLVVDLVEEPATHYGQPQITEEDRHYATLTRAYDGLRYEPVLGHAARELAGFHSQNDQLASGEILSFLLDAAGAAEWTVEQLLTVTTVATGEPIENLLSRVRERWRRGDPPLRVGIGEAWTLARPARRHLIALVTRGRLEIDRVPRQVRAGDSLTVSGFVPPAIPEVDILVMGPDLAIMEAAVTRQGDRFTSVIPMGETPGQAWVELIGDGPQGPKPMAQLSVYIDQELPWVFETQWPPDESDLDSVSAAEARANALFQADRRRFGLPAIPRSADLDAVARAHSQDMAANDFFSHVSPTTGSVTDRLASADVRTVLHGENIARNETLWDAEAGLMRSIGHRRNILHPRATEVGIGIAPVTKGNNDYWVLTQVVARPMAQIDPVHIEREVFEALDDAREAAGLPRFRVSKALSRAARTEAESGAPSPRGVLDRAEGALKRGGWAWMSILSELADLEVPEKLLDSSWRSLGVGVHQDLERAGPTIVVVLVVGG